MSRYDILLENSKPTPDAPAEQEGAATVFQSPQKTNRPRRAPTKDKSPQSQTPSITSNKNTKTESKLDSEQASNRASMIENIRRGVKVIGKEVSFVRLTQQEKNLLADIVYTYKRQGVRTSENEINRIAINLLVEEYKTHGQESILAKVIEALNA